MGLCACAALCPVGRASFDWAPIILLRPKKNNLKVSFCIIQVMTASLPEIDREQGQHSLNLLPTNVSYSQN